MLGLWVSARTQFHALTADKDPIRLKGDTDPTDSELSAAKKWRKEHDAEWLEAVSGPQRFGAFVGLPHVLGEPPKKTVKTAEELKRQHANLDEDLTANLAAAFEGLVEAKRG